ncbi:hypothetical protein T484DRAFT_1772094 [Baffinella frigidus]|nr:hypothetical protein T484DRAFT_1772094 [Cryptophyta sp. CCMP2293]
MSASAGCAARPSNGASQIRRLTSCVFHVILFAACLQAVGGDATLGQSTDLRVWQYVDRGVVLAWTQTYPDAATGRNVSEYRVWDGPALLESVTPDAAGVVTSCENASEPCTFPPCNDECYTAELRVVVPNLYPGTMHNLSVDAVFSLEVARWGGAG